MAVQQYLAIHHSLWAILTLWLTWTQLSIASDTLPVSLFVDAYCDNASPLNPIFDVPLDTCIVTPGAFSFKVPSFTCTDGSAVKFLKYSGSACGSTGWNSDGTWCQDLYPSPVVGFVIYCGAEEQLQVASTMTIAVGTNVVSATARASTAATGRSTTSVQSSGSTDSPNPSTSGGSSPHGWAALSNGERIGAIIALAVGIPAVVFAGIGVWLACIRGSR